MEASKTSERAALVEPEWGCLDTVNGSNLKARSESQEVDKGALRGGEQPKLVASELGARSNRAADMQERNR